MLDLLRRKAQSPYIQGTILVIVIVFVFWGVGSYKGDGPNTVATVNDAPITYQQYQKIFEQTMARYRDQFGGSIPSGLLESLGIKKQVLDQLVQQTLLQQAAQKTGLLVSTQEVQDTIKGMESFRQDGIFNLQRYNDILAASRLSAADFEGGIRSDILDQKVLGYLSRFARTSEAELKERFAFEYDQIKIDYATCSADSFRDKAQYLEEELEAFYAGQKEKYKTDPQIKLKYVAFPFSQTKGENASFSEEEIAQYYKQNIANYAIPEQRWARHILIKASADDTQEKLAEKRDKLQSILDMARSGANFAELAKQYSEDSTTASQGGNLGFFAQGQMVKPFEDAAFAMKKGEVSSIVQTQFGFHLIKVEDIKDGIVTPFAEARQHIIQSLSAEKAKKSVYELANQAYEKIILAGSLEKYAEGGQAQIQETDFFARKSPPKNLTEANALLDAAFTLKKGELSSLVESRDMYAILYVADMKEPQEQPLSAVRAPVEKEFLAERAKKLAQKAAESLLGQVKNGTDFSVAAKEANLEIKTTDFYDRNAQSANGLPIAIAQKGFQLSAKTPYPAEVLEGGTNFYVLRYNAKKPAGQELYDKKRAELNSMLLMEKQLKVVGAWVKYLEEKADVTTNEKILQ